ncbi:CCRG-2 family RiPP [Synechococcus sp. RS9916]|uniref:CCRG-2 family RiPP n=1 Tax=Synechococcus sp. RS9916 TaxID=221359 RepID=UPI0000E534C8|nr:CCRG-2 family RiPP [Synechococcus sp. RS9916]EAU74225.1 hypothetical protein RS9916_31997 [Synechococcus sp. RS9916]
MTNTELTLDQLQAISGGSKYINDAGTQGSMKCIDFDSQLKTKTLKASGLQLTRNYVLDYTEL